MFLYIFHLPESIYSIYFPFSRISPFPPIKGPTDISTMHTRVEFSVSCLRSPRLEVSSEVRFEKPMRLLGASFLIWTRNAQQQRLTFCRCVLLMWFANQCCKFVFAIIFASRCVCLFVSMFASLCLYVGLQVCVAIMCCMFVQQVCSASPCCKFVCKSVL